MGKHTPGPWKDVPIDPLGNEHKASRKVFAPKSSTYVLVAGNNQTADARLIAAAPDLLTALNAIMACIDGDTERGATVHMGPITIDAARSAIARAEGGES